MPGESVCGPSVTTVTIWKRTNGGALCVYSPHTSEATAAPTAPQAASRPLPTLVSDPVAVAVVQLRISRSEGWAVRRQLGRIRTVRQVVGNIFLPTRALKRDPGCVW